MAYNTSDINRYDVVIHKGRYFSLVIEDDTIVATQQFAGSIENLDTQVDLITFNVDLTRLAEDKVIFYLRSTETVSLAEGDRYIYDVKTKATADDSSDWTQYVWGYAQVTKTVTP